MKKLWGILLVTVLATVAMAAPIRVLVMDFDDETGQAPDARLGGMSAQALAQKGMYVLGKELLNKPGFTLIDRRDFLKQMDELKLKDGGEATPTRPSFLQAAQALRADIVLRGMLQSFSTGKQLINQGGYQADFSTLAVGVAIEALDAVDGAIIAMSDGSAREQFRQTAASQTVLSEDDVINVFKKAVANSLPELEKSLDARAEAQAQRPTIKLSISTDADPSLVEIDGILVGSSPIKDLEIYKGDHVLTVGKPGYQDVTKRIMFEKDSQVTVPMIRVKLTAEEMKEVLEKMRMHVFVGEPGMVIHTIEEEIND